MIFIPPSPLLVSEHSGKKAAWVRALLPFAAASWPIALLASISLHASVLCEWQELQDWPNNNATSLCCTAVPEARHWGSRLSNKETNKTQTKTPQTKKNPKQPNKKRPQTTKNPQLSKPPKFPLF